jgi:glycosyltransferase EpsD
MGVSKEKFYRAEGERPEGKTLICIGEFNDNKNQAFLIRAMRKLPEDVKLLLLGEGDNLEKYRDMVKELDLTSRVEIVGRVSDARPYIVRAAVGTSVSIREGFGIAACEEMMCGLPVVLSDNRGHNELISEDGCEGFLVKDFDENAFAAAVTKLFSDKPLYAKMSKAARERALSDFELEVSTGRLKKIYGIE